MAAAGVRRALAFVTSAYSSYSCCRQYLEDIERARAEAGPGAPEIDKLRHYFDHPGFVEPFADATLARGRIAARRRAGAGHLVFTAHSVPAAMAGGQRAAARRPVRGPAGQEAARLVADRAAAATGEHPGSWSTRAAAARPASPGSARTSATT